MRLLVLPLATTLATHALADDYGGNRLELALLLLWRQARDPDAYTEQMKQNTSLSGGSRFFSRGRLSYKNGRIMPSEN